MVPTNDAEADNVSLVIEDLESLPTVSGGEAGDDVDFPEGTHVAVTDDDLAALEEMFVRLWVVEAADD